jgi:hypothetical protein
MMHIKNSPIADLENILNKNSETYKIYSSKGEEGRKIGEHLEKQYPIASWGRVEWDKVDKAIIYNTENHDEEVNAIKKICENCNLKGSIFILWCDISKPCLSMDLSTALKYISDIIAEDWDTWILNLEDKWCIEVYHEGEVCFGYANNLEDTHDLTPDAAPTA